ncbi:LAMI_0F14136g1_1 [Lachancea mirantina]|uniref:Serine/threonine-protein phosphatase 4 regulatory subunit 3 n=1 Tax=Lachancea mirantina TaxID=1230905 RepID=A0A1G4K3P0_9SACH|nr:LAMI_0F14136g1_1 [Lachancea mirantina]
MNGNPRDELQETEPKRVKVYVLEDNEWRDTGTGFCVGHLDGACVKNGENGAFLVVTDEELPDNVLLKSKLEGNIEYQRQEETLIVWKDLTCRDIALSFEESTGCDALCDFIVKIQKSVEMNISLVAVRSNDDGMGSVHEIITGPVNLPSNDKDQDDKTLLEALRILNENTAFEFLRKETVEFVLAVGYVSTLVHVFQKAEQNHKHRSLILLSSIVKTLFLYNQRQILEEMVTSENIIGVAGILEYDLEYPDRKANHREYLQRSGFHFKEVVPLKSEEMKNIIKKAFRLQFLKDVVLVRFLDDHTFNLISDVILDFQACIIDFIQRDSFLTRLFALYTDTSVPLESKRDGIRMLHQCVQIAQNIDSLDKSKFFRTLVRSGFFDVIEYAFNVETDSGVRILATDMVITIIEHDVFLINSVNNECANNRDAGSDQNPSGQMVSLERATSVSSDVSLLMILSKILLTDKSLGLKEQVVQALNTLLHPEGCMEGNTAYQDEQNGDLVLGFCNDAKEFKEHFGANNSQDQTLQDIPQILDYFTKFYEVVAPFLFKPLMDLTVLNETSDVLLQHLIKLIAFITTEHDRVISQKFILSSQILSNLATLLRPTHTLQLRLTVVRCIKSILLLDDEIYQQELMAQGVYRPLMGLLEENINEDNLANSCLLDFFHLVSTHCSRALEMDRNEKSGFVLLNRHLVDHYESILQQVNYVPTISNMINMRNGGGVVVFGDMCGGSEEALDGKISSLLPHVDPGFNDDNDSEKSVTFKRAMDKLSAVPPPISIKEDVLKEEG